jgi:hypothetical protein
MATWPDKSGSMRYRPEQLTIDNAQLQSAIDTCYTDLLKLDLVIEKYAYALELIQPSATGKMAIRFLKRPWGGAEGRHPQVVQWYKSRNGRFLYNRLKTNEVLRKVKGYPVFAPVKEDVKTILREAIAMIEHREALLGAVNNFKRQLGSMFKRNETYAKEKEEQIAEWLPALRDRREELLVQWRESVEAAQEGLPVDAVANPRKKPRVDLTGQTRGRVHETRRPNT